MQPPDGLGDIRLQQNQQDLFLQNFYLISTFCILLCLLCCLFSLFSFNRTRCLVQTFQLSFSFYLYLFDPQSFILFLSICINHLLLLPSPVQNVLVNEGCQSQIHEMSLIPLLVFNSSYLSSLIWSLFLKQPLTFPRSLDCPLPHPLLHVMLTLQVHFVGFVKY